MIASHRVGMWAYAHPGGEIHFLNDFHAILGLAPRGLAFSSLDELKGMMEPDDVAGYDEAFNSVLAGDPAARVTYRLRDGEETIWLEDHFAPYLDENGVQTGVLAYTEETAEQLCEERIKVIETRYKTLVNALFPDFVFVFDEEFNFVDVITPDGLRLFHDKRDIIRMSGREIYSPEVSDLFIKNIHEAFEKGRMKEIEYHLDLFGTRYYYKARIMPVEGRQAFCLIHDIGLRVRRMEDLMASRRKAEEADRMKSAFLANMSHEIRTPLNAIVGFAEVLLEEQDEEERKEYAGIIRKNSGLLLQLINDILDISKIESGAYEMKFAETELGELLQEAKMLPEQKLGRGVELILEAPEVEVKVFTDRNRVKQVLYNLLSNAVKNTKQGSIRLKAAVEEHHVRFSVSDTGCGIPAEKLKSIFHRFEKLNDFSQGTGLGLAICETLVERLGGEIGVESELGKGSIFWFTIPYKVQPKRVASGLEQRINSDEYRALRRKTILVVEESDSDFEFLRGLFQKNYHVVRASTGEEAVSSFILDNPQFILLNIQLSDMSGIDVAKKIRTMSTTIPIVAVTTSDFYMEQRWAIESGCNDVISKPYSGSQVEETVIAFI